MARGGRGSKAKVTGDRCAIGRCVNTCPGVCLDANATQAIDRVPPLWTATPYLSSRGWCVVRRPVSQETSQLKFIDGLVFIMCLSFQWIHIGLSQVQLGSLTTATDRTGMVKQQYMLATRARSVRILSAAKMRCTVWAPLIHYPTRH